MQDAEPVPWPALRDLQTLIAQLNASRDLGTTLRMVVDGVVAGMGFGVAVVNLVRDDGRLEVVAVAGADDVRTALLGQVGGGAHWDIALALADRWGALRYVPHDRYPETDDPLPTWVPDVAVPDDPDGWHPLDALFAPLYAPTGELVGVLSVDLPVDGRQPGGQQRKMLEMYATQAGVAIDNARLHARLDAERELFRRAFDDAPIGMAISDLRPGTAGRYLRVNDALCLMLRYSREELLTLSFPEITHPDDLERDRAALQAALAGDTGRYRAEKRYLRRDGSVVWVAVCACPIPGPQGAETFVTQFVDITDRKRTESELLQRALHDPLTGLPNRLLLVERLEHAMATSMRHGRPATVLFCDLDGFKTVNDTYGHAAGDAVLVAVADRLIDQVREGDTVARFGGDEFVVLLEDVDVADVAGFAARVGAAVAAPVRFGAAEMTVTMSVGAAAVDPRADGPDDVLRRADREMYDAKRSRPPVEAVLSAPR